MLPQGQYILTHAPVAPWFSPGLWPDNGYLGVNAAVGNLIDWYNVQVSQSYPLRSRLLTAIFSFTTKVSPNIPRAPAF